MYYLTKQSIFTKIKREISTIFNIIYCNSLKIKIGVISYFKIKNIQSLY